MIKTYNWHEATDIFIDKNNNCCWHYWTIGGDFKLEYMRDNNNDPSVYNFIIHILDKPITKLIL